MSSSELDELELEIELDEFKEEIILLLEEYLENNLKKYSSPEFQEKMKEDMIDFITKIYFLENKDDFSEKEEEMIVFLIEDIFSFYQIPKRQVLFVEKKEKVEIERISESLQKLEEINQLQPKQRTSEWYQYRYHRFSASSIWKLLSTPAQYNSLILEKCKKPSHDNLEQPITNYNNPRNWGLKYEQVSIMIYEDKHPTTILKNNYGCIPHPMYSFIAASPDGINISPECPEKYGRMVEVKNIYNREITGIPLEEYWIQMQIQMETCGLDVCDFLETRMKEYSGEEAFYSDISPEYKGVILFLLGKGGQGNRFEYMPLYVNLEKKHVDKWIREIREKVSDTHFIYEVTYWYLDEYSCVVVERNRPWFESVLPVFEEAWNIVISERKYGYTHREPKSTTSTTKTTKNNICVVKLTGNKNN